MLKRLLCLDFETFYADDYTLSSMTTESYVRDPRFTAICLGYSDGKGWKGWVPAAEIPAFLAQFDWSETGVLCHNAQFDGLILSHHYGVHPAFFACTLSMARLVHPDRLLSLKELSEFYRLPPKTVPYDTMRGVHPSTMSRRLLEAVGAGSQRDCENTFVLFERMTKSNSKPFPPSELPIVDMTVKMFTSPRLVGNAAGFRSLKAAEQREQEELLARVGVTAKELGSDDKFKALLEAVGVEVAYKESKAVPGKMNPAFAASDQLMRDLVVDDNLAISELAKARLRVRSKITETRAERLATMADRGPSMPVFLNYFGARRTSRWSGGDKLNFQNFPRSGELGECISAPPGERLIIADSSQIECRILCFVAGQMDVLEAFAGGRDIYTEQAEAIYGRPVVLNEKGKPATGADDTMRFVGKRTELSSGYGCGWLVLYMSIRALGVPISEEEAQKAIRVYRARHPKVTAMWEEGNRVLEALLLGTRRDWLNGILRVEENTIVLPNGVPLQCILKRDPEDTRGGLVAIDRRGNSFTQTRIWGGALTGKIVQSLARTYLSQALVRLKLLAGLEPLCLRHDEIVYSVPEEQVDETLHVVEKELKRAPAWLPGIPLDCEI